LFVVAIEPKAKENVRTADRLSIFCYADGVHNEMWYKRGSEYDVRNLSSEFDLRESQLRVWCQGVIAQNVMSGSHSSECDVREL